MSSDTTKTAAKTTFYGRRRQLDELEQAFGTSPLVTVVGPGGVGKTRLAREFVARGRIVERGQGEAWFVDLSAKHTEDEVLAALAARAPGGGAHSADAEQLRQWLSRLLNARPGRAVVFDNCEQLDADAVALIAQFVAVAPEVKWLATSRRPLELDAETAVVLEPLEHDAAVALFVDRAYKLPADPHADATLTATIGRLVDRLDRLPLAIELAAGRTRLLTPQMIEDHLDERFALLRATGADDRPQRHRALEATLQWSWHHLDVRAREVLAAASVFPAALTAAQLRQVLELADADALWPVGLLEELLDLGLIYEASRADGAPAVRLYESVRQFARQKLEGGGERDAVYQRYVISTVTQAEALMEAELGPEGAQARQALLAMRADLWRCVELGRQDHPELAARAALVLAYWLRRVGPRYRLDSLLEATRPLVEQSGRDDLRLRLVVEAAWLEWFEGRLDEATALLESAYRQATASGIARLAVRMGRHLVVFFRMQGALDKAEQVADDTVRLARTHNDPVGQALCLSNAMALYSRMGQLERARKAAEEALELLEAHSHPAYQSSALTALAATHRFREHFAVARDYLERSLAIARQTGNLESEATMAEHVVIVSLDCGDFGKAVAEAERACELNEQFGNRMRNASALGALATAHHLAGRLDEAHKIFEEGLRLAKRRRHEWDRVILHGHLGLLMWENDRQAEATQHLEQCCSLLDEHGGFVRMEAMLRPCLAVLTGRGQKAAFEAARERLEPFQCDHLLFLDLLERLDAARSSGRVEALQPELDALQGRARQEPMLAQLRLLVRVAQAVERRLRHPDELLTLRVASQCRDVWLPDGTHLDLSRRSAVRLILCALVQRRVSAPGEGLSTYELIEIGWPDQHLDVDSGTNRLYNAIHVLRDLGLKDALVKHDDGYVLTEQWRVKTDG
ncbi:tetratricopeptide repeat protein [Persicimonas caeni]|uniref:Tetratricopeptide repeat protein n=1 Tax=Persicimonas caeni TaxID=2292766 RepID=A0A4Y6Q088_PERCE|nr:tetratricopeptide repeat protein [Persicimonas caeni]QDG53415.1 tetratricopeptide repeat protein [Persicimonas caeni]QED34636.1 tetratricopeptide repeat protein [Persicimonas caeni]